MSHRIIAAFVAFILIATACGRSTEAEDSTTTTIASTSSTAATSDDASAEAQSETTNSSTRVTSTTDPAPSGPLSPLTGLPVEDATLLDRKLIAVKVDNHPNAQPQSGVEQADAMIELLVESGWTRLIALFLESDVEWLGPIRSVRPTDSTLIVPLNGVLQMSGGQSWIRARVTGDGMALIGEVGAPTTMRWNQRNAPHNLYVNTEEIRNVAGQRGLDQTPPEPLFVWGPLPATEQADATTILFDWSNRVDITWEWTGSEYLRFVGDDPHNWRTMEGDIEEQISADTLVVLRAERYTACPSGAGSCVPAWDTVGQNGAMVFAGGKYVSGTWERDSITEWFTLTTADGQEITVPAGRLWIMVYPDTADILWDEPLP